MNELDPASREQFDEVLVSTSVDLWKKIQGRPNEARAFLDAAVATLRREQEHTKLKQAVRRHIIGMGMKRLRDEGVEVKQIVSRTRLDDQVGKRVSRAWVDKHMLTGDQMKEIADVFSRAERAYDQIANDRDVFTATRAGARRTSNQLRGLMRWIGVRLSGAAAVVGATWAATECGSGPGTVTLAAGGSLATTAAASGFAGGPPNLSAFTSERPSATKTHAVPPTWTTTSTVQATPNEREHAPSSAETTRKFQGKAGAVDKTTWKAAQKK
ncbi:hypothetical protein AB0F17_61940 [Nonomuraea sp. NPDC026600]|uniref:hypothetical protein n=1 Tax=Nonomuraea sp. NPDC026600 TaxID=3155363 RepID=UPI00340905FD